MPSRVFKLLRGIAHRLLFQSSPPFTLGRLIIVSLACAYALVSVLILGQSIADTDKMLSRDLHQDYLMGRAVNLGLNPYTPIPQLSEAVLGISHKNFNPHPSPHPPVAAVVFSVLTLVLPQATFHLGWLALSVCMLAAIVFLCLKFVRGTTSYKQVLLLTSVLILSEAAILDLWHGQYQLLCLLFLCLFLWFLRSKNESAAGLCLATSVSLKFFGWPFFIFLLMFRYRTAFVSAAVSTVCMQALACAVLGHEIFFNYYQNIATSVSRLWINNLWNISPYGMLFGLIVWPTSEIRVEGDGVVFRPKLFDISQSSHYELLTLLSIALLTVLALVAIIREHRRKDLVSQSLRFLVLSVAVLPLVWAHTLVYLIPLFVFAVVQVESLIKDRLQVDWRLLTFMAITSFLLFYPVMGLVSPASYPSYFDWGEETSLMVIGPWFSVVLKAAMSVSLIVLLFVPLNLERGDTRRQRE